MIKGIRVTNMVRISALFLLTTATTLVCAAPFSIAPKDPLPTIVTAGGSIMASYTVTNLSKSQRNNNYVKYLSPNTSIASGGCADSFYCHG
jgi:hypothetical protein